MRCDGQIQSGDLWFWFLPARPQGCINEKVGGRDRWRGRVKGESRNELVETEDRQKRETSVVGILEFL